MDHATPPPFQPPKDTVDVGVKSLLSNNELLISHGVQYSKYLHLKPLQRDDVMKETKTMTFHFKDENAFIDCRRIFLELEFFAQLSDGNAIEKKHYVSGGYK